MPHESNGKSRPGTAKSAKRREELRRSLPKPGIDLKALFLRRELINTLLIFTGFFLLAASVVLHTRERTVPAVGQVMSHARTKRVSFEIVNQQATEEKREEARRGSPRVYRLNQSHLEQLSTAIGGLPEVVAGKVSAGDLAGEVANRFMLTDETIALLQQYVMTDEATELPEATKEWQDWTEHLVRRELPTTPTIAGDRFDNERLEPPDPLFVGPHGEFSTDAFAPANDSADNRGRWEAIAERAGFPEGIVGVIVAALSKDREPLYVFDEEETRARSQRAADSVVPVVTVHRSGEVIYRRGEVIAPDHVAVIASEEDAYRRSASFLARAADATGVWGVVALATMILAGYLVRFYPRIIRNPLRVVAIAGLCIVMLGVCAWITLNAPAFMYFAAVSTTLLVGMMLVIAYDQRLAMTVGYMQCALVTFALHESIGFYIMVGLINGGAVAWLREVRHRNTLIRAAAFSAIIACAAAFFVGVLEIPILDGDMNTIPGAWKQIWSNAGLAALGALLVGFLLLGILPSIERLFDMTTGMTLLELRDTRQPLLRQLQERAAGTYNHSLQVATVAEAGAEAIGADSLLAYVGGLYHDIGKMNKPDYFVENQAGGQNKHDKLRPAMSLLVIVGHVKDGVELAREYNLPRPVIHFIESHHGTTLVEYFYHQARSKAESAGADAEKVAEIEYRYPGPKPRTREAAILMIADASESTVRAMETPTAKSIETTVRRLSRKRLEDGQFDKCDLTLRELSQIEDAIIKAIISLYHTRIAYPKGEDASAEPTKPERRAVVGKAG